MQVEILTGRLHQIRAQDSELQQTRLVEFVPRSWKAHLSGEGFPLLGGSPRRCMGCTLVATAGSKELTFLTEVMPRMEQTQTTTQPHL